MTDIEANQTAVEPGLDEATPPPVEPWTPTRVVEWNAYYDVYVAAFVLALAFLGSANKIQSANSGLWSMLQTGRQISEARSPIGIGGSTLAAEGQRWVNIPWLFEVIHYQVFQNVAALAPPPAAGGAAPAGPLSIRGDQAAAGALVALGALIRAITAWLLLGLRRKGPGLWWTALCVTAALGVSLSPEPVESVANNPGGQAVRVVQPALGIQLGGIAGTAAVTPETWGLMFVALELFLLHQAINLGKTSRLYALIPLFALWTNTDETFSFGLLILGAATLGRFFDVRRDPKSALVPGPSPRTIAIVLLASFATTFLNPAHLFGVLGGFGILFGTVTSAIVPPSPPPVSVFGSSFRAGFGAAFTQTFQVYYAVLVVLGLASFGLNRRRFSVARLLMFALASVVWALALVYTGPFALVLVAVLALNGQEWYLDTLGTAGRLGAGWVVWSTGGRLLTIAIIFGAIFQATTGWGGQVGEARFGFGFDPDDFPFEAAEAVAAAPVEGNVLNTTLAQGDALAWRASGKRKPYIDSKTHLYSPQVLTEFDNLRKAIRDDKVETWRPILDQAKITSVMIQTAGAPITYAKLINSANWVLFYDDGAVAMFGRADDSLIPGDVTFFKANRLDAIELAFKRPKAVPAWVGAPQAVGAVDNVFRNRLLNRPQPHVSAAQHWLRPASVAAGANYLPDPAHCLLAIRELRTALSSKPDDFTAYRLLGEAYRLLLAQESALIAGIAPSQENIPRILQAAPQPRFLSLRTRQLLTALNSAAQTLPPARTPLDRVERADLNYNLAQLNLQNGSLDLARERLLSIEGRTGELNEDFIKNRLNLMSDLNARIEQIQDQLKVLTVQQRALPIKKADTARSSGAPGLAIRELEEAEGTSGGQGGIRPMLIDLYNDTGQADKALELVTSLSLNVDDPSLSNGIGTGSHRQGMIYFLLGDYRNAIALWGERSISQIRTYRLMQAPAATQTLLRGEAIAATRMFIELPEQVDQQAEWEFELAMAALEAGLPSAYVAEHLRTALELEPNLGVRPVIAYYLEQLGEPVPPPRPTTRPAAIPSPAAPTPVPAPAINPIPDSTAGELPANPLGPDAPSAPKP